MHGGEDEALSNAGDEAKEDKEVLRVAGLGGSEDAEQEPEEEGEGEDDAAAIALRGPAASYLRARRETEILTASLAFYLECDCELMFRSSRSPASRNPIHQ